MSDTPRTDELYKNLYQPGIPDGLIESASGIERDFMRQLERENRELAEKIAIAEDEASMAALHADAMEEKARELAAALRDMLAEASGTEKSCGHDYACICAGDAARAALAKVQP